MSTVPFSNVPSSFDFARRDDFFGYGNPMQAIESTYRNANGIVQQPSQVITAVTTGSIPPDMALASSGGTFFDLRSPDEIFAEMDARLNRQRQTILNSPRILQMLEQKQPNAK